VATAYIGEIKVVGWNFAPYGWAMCNGQLMSISENAALFQVIGTAYGGDGVTNFALPDLRGRLPVHQGTGYAMGQAAGSETVTLTIGQVPVHPHSFMCSTDGATKGVPTQNVPAGTGSGNAYIQAVATAAMAPGSIPPSGGNGQPHPNIQPYQCVTFIISLSGIFPSPT
jgi:microcystin-dependent protein